MGNSGGSGSFIPTTQVWDIGDIGSQEGMKELLVRLYQNMNVQALSVNTRDSGYYDTSEFVNGQIFFSTATSDTSSSPVLRQVFRKVVNFGALPNAATKNVAHGITVTDSFIFTRIYGAATDPTGHNYIPLPYASSVAANNIELKVDGTNVTIITGTNRTAFTTTYVILEYLKQ